ncbi:MAG: site-2 protease family protein [Atopobiaceae bacterium]|jgi:regulator of sigma E protease
MEALSAVFWGLLLLSALVFVHEGGHFLASRAFGVRVTEFFLGLPCPWRLSFTSRSYGTEIGITPVLIGGYNRICGMEGDADELLPKALGLLTRRGRITSQELASELGCDEERAQNLLVCLSDWASAKPFYDPEKGERPSQRYYPETFVAPARDANLLTVYDRGHDLEAAGSNAEGQARELALSDDELYAAERSHVYVGLCFWKRVVTLAAGVAVNIVLGMALIVAVLGVEGVRMGTNTTTVAEVTQGSLAEQAGLVAGDAIESIGGVPVSTWSDIATQLEAALKTDGFDVTYAHDGTEVTRHVAVDASEPPSYFGVTQESEIRHVDPVTGLRVAWDYVGEMAGYVVKLIEPQHTVEVMNNSTSVVGISVMASQAAQSGPADFSYLAALISLSLGLMNLLPIPPLDGGKIVIEVVQALMRRQLSMRAQAIVSYVGVALFLGLFVYVLRLDVLRIITG